MDVQAHALSKGLLLKQLYACMSGPALKEYDIIRASPGDVLVT